MPIFIIITWFGILYLGQGSLTSETTVIYTGLCLVSLAISMKD